MSCIYSTHHYLSMYTAPPVQVDDRMKGEAALEMETDSREATVVLQTAGGRGRGPLPLIFSDGRKDDSTVAPSLLILPPRTANLRTRCSKYSVVAETNALHFLP